MTTITMRHRAAHALAPYLAGLSPSVFARQVRHAAFIAGCGRSGTTLLHALLTAHPAIASYPTEANDLWHPGLYPWHRSAGDVPPFWVDPYAFTRASLARRPRGHDRRLRAVFGAFAWLMRRPVFLNKSVMITFMLPHVAALFPGARFIHVLRDGRAVALSYARKQEEKTAGAGDAYQRRGYQWDFPALIERFATHWAQHVLAMDEHSQALGLRADGRLLELRYEDLCDQPAAQLRRVAGFLGVDPDACPAISDGLIRRPTEAYRQELDARTLSRVHDAVGRVLLLKGYAV